MDDSKFNLWRATFSFCFVDGFLSKEEQSHIEEKLSILKFDEAQKSILMKDLRSPPDFNSLLPLITKPADRSFLINHIRVLAKIDDNLSLEEKAKIEEVKSAVLSQLNLKELNQTIADDEKASYHEDEVYKVDNKHSYAEAVIKSLQKALNPGDYKKPKE
jgi:hypothetical protein